MSTRQKLMERLLRREFAGWTFHKLERVLLYAGFVEVSRNGSHRTFKHPLITKLITLKGSGPLPPGYAREVFRRLRELENHTHAPERPDDHR